MEQMKITKKYLKKIIKEEYNRILRETRYYQPDLMSAQHDNGRPNNLSIALDIAWNDILETQDPFGSARFSGMDRYNRSEAYKVGYYTFFKRVAETDQIPGMGFAGQNPNRDGVMKDIENYAYMEDLIKSRKDLADAVKGYAKAYNVVDQQRQTFYRAGPRPETWSS